MTSRTSSRRRRQRHAGGAARPIVAAGVALVIVGVVAVIMLARPDTPRLAVTGEMNAMGLPVVTTPGGATGATTVGDVSVTGANWALGAVPLNVSVQPTWTLANTGENAVTLGEPHAEVREGCCPGPLTLDQRTLAPGETTTLTFDLAMHEGMDGWHDITVHVPISDADAPLTMTVTGHFGS